MEVIHPIISIVMPMYGVEDYVGKAIESVLKQTYPYWELLIVNDGSIDRSRAVASQYASIDSRIKILDKDNGGLSDARNFGLKFAEGDFIHFFDSDDWIEADFYEKCISSISNENDFILLSYTISSDENVSKENVKHAPILNIPLEKPDTMIDSLTPFLNFAWNKFYRRSFLVKNKLIFQKGLSRVEDCEFMSKVFKCRSSYKIVDISGYHYMIRSRSTLSNYFDSKLIEHIKIRIFASEIIYLNLGCSIPKVASLLSNMAEFGIREYYHQLFCNSNIKGVSNLWKHFNLILKDKAIISSLRKKDNRLLKKIIKYHFNWFIFFIYLTRYRIPFK